MKDIFIESQGKDFVNELSPENVTGLYLELENYKKYYFGLLAQEAEFSLAQGREINFQPDKFAVVREDKFKLLGEPEDFKKLQEYVTQRLTFFNMPSLVTDRIKTLEESVKQEIVECIPALKKTFESVYEILDSYPIWIETEKDELKIIETKNEKGLVKRINYTTKNVLKWDTEYGFVSADFYAGFSKRKKDLIIYRCGTAPFDDKTEKEMTIQDVEDSFKKIVDIGQCNFDVLAFLNGTRKVLALPDLIIHKLENMTESLKEDIS
jgi:hypothetical protein